MAGLRETASAFFTFFSVVLLSQYIAVTFAMTCVAAARDFSAASLIANMGYTVQSMACGFFIQSNSIPVYVRWLKWTAYVYYAFGALCANEFVGQFYDCPYEGGESNPACTNYTGAYIMSSLGFPQVWITEPIGIMVAFAIGFYFLAWVGLRFRRVEMTIARQRTPDVDLSAGKEKMTARSAAEVSTSCLRICEISTYSIVLISPRSELLTSHSINLHLTWTKGHSGGKVCLPRLSCILSLRPFKPEC